MELGSNMVKKWRSPVFWSVTPLAGWEADAVRMGHACLSLSLLVQNELPGEVPGLASCCHCPQVQYNE